VTSSRVRGLAALERRTLQAAADAIGILARSGSSSAWRDSGADVHFVSMEIRWVWGAALALFLSGCSSVGTELIVHTAYGESAGLLTVMSVFANVHVAGSVGAQFGIGADSSFGECAPVIAGADGSATFEAVRVRA
jgi:hypothetical protein